jgi:hypothetical protein
MFLTLPPTAAAAAPVDGSVEASTEGVNWTPPERVVGGNAVSLLLPFQIGVAGYMPKAKVALQYDRQFNKAHWGYVSAGFLADRGNYENFRMDECGFEDDNGDIPSGLCGNGSVLGFEFAAGYSHKFYLKETPWFVPFMRLGLGYAWWKLPDLSGGVSQRNQVRTSTWTLNLQPAGGFRVFFTGDFGLGFEVQLPLGFAVNKVIPDGGTKSNEGAFLFGVSTLLGLEYRF